MLLDRGRDRVPPDIFEPEGAQQAESEQDEWDERDERAKGDRGRVGPETMLVERDSDLPPELFAHAREPALPNVPPGSCLPNTRQR